MGIVSYCPSGHRVKVKDHLAGKKGICPTCGATFRIPLATAAQTPAARPEVAGLPVAAVVSLDHERAASLPPALALAIAAPHAAQSPEPRRGDPSPAPREGLEPEAEIMIEPEELQPAAVPTAIVEAAEAAWCVAVPGGEASRPMSGTAMLEWLGSDDVTGSELVWRSDWPDWRPISDVFPDHVPSPTRGGGLTWP